MGTLDHHNIMKLRGVVEGQEIPGIVMDYMPKGTLKSYLPTLKDLAGDDKYRFRIAAAIANGLEYMHELNFIHRDLKTGNVLIDYDGTPKISDFGSAAKLEEGEDVYVDAGSWGTFPWFAPEAIKTLKANQKREYSKATDVYTFGTLLWAISTYMEPYELSGPASTLVQLGHQFSVCRDIESGKHENEKLLDEPALKRLCLKAWSLNPDDRPKISKFVKKLEEINQLSDGSDDSDSSEDSEKDHRASYATYASYCYHKNRRK